MAFCPKCGNEVTNTAKFCCGCGAEVGTAPQSAPVAPQKQPVSAPQQPPAPAPNPINPATQKQSKKVPVMMLGIGAVGVLVAVGAFLMGTRAPKSTAPTNGTTTAGTDAQEKEKTNPKDGATLVWVPAGEFKMGSNAGEANEKPQRTVTLDGVLDLQNGSDSGTIQKIL